MPITATFEYGGQTHSNVPVINPGGWFGKTWLLEIGGSYDAVYLIVEADSVCDAIDELADSEQHGHHINVEDDRLGDYEEESRSYAGNDSHVVDLDWLLVHGDEVHGRGNVMPFRCRYVGEGLPAGGVLPTQYDEYWDEFTAA